MRIDLTTLDGRHLLLSYAAVFLMQGGYLVYVVRGWLKLKRRESAEPNE